MKESRRRVESIRLPCLVFTPDELLLLEKSLVLLKQMLVTNQVRHANVGFAHETIAHLQSKLYQIMGRFEDGEGVPLDANEVIILHTSVQLFALALRASQEKERMQCVELCCKLAPVVSLGSR